MAVLPPALPMIADYLGGGVAGEITAQRARSLPFLGLVIGGLLAGGLIARFGLRRCLILAALCFAAAGLGGGTAGSATPLLISCFVAGLAAAVLSYGLTTATGAVMAGDARIRTLGFETALCEFSAIGGGIVAAFLAQFHGWHAPFTIYVGFGLLALLLVAGSRTPVVPGDNAANGLASAARKAARSIPLDWSTQIMGRLTTRYHRRSASASRARSSHSGNHRGGDVATMPVGTASEQDEATRVPVMVFATLKIESTRFFEVFVILSLTLL